MTSYYELTHPLGKIRPQSFLDTFDGGSLRSWWTTRTLDGTGGVFAMVDSSNEGYSLTSPSTGTASKASIDFNNFRPIDPANSVLIAEIRQVTTTFVLTQVGFTNDATTSASTNSLGITIWDSSSDSLDEFSMFADDGGGATSVTIASPADQNWHRFKIQCFSTMQRAIMDGDFVGVQTTDLPTVKVQPYFRSVHRNSNVSRESRIRYLECFNL